MAGRSYTGRNSKPKTSERSRKNLRSVASSMAKHTRKSGRPIALVASVAEFIAEIHNLPDPPPSLYPDLMPGLYTYRGLRNRTWESRPSLFRDENAPLFKHERDIILEIQAVHPGEFARDNTMFDRLVRMQHFNLPTRLLDVTANPLVALYFASELSEPETDGSVVVYSVPRLRVKFFSSEIVSCVANLCNLSSREKEQIGGWITDRDKSIADFHELPATQHLLELVRRDIPAFSQIYDPDQLDFPWYVIPKLSNRRIIAQSGAFLLHGINTGEAPFPSDMTITTQRIDVRRSAKPSIRWQLNTLGINGAALFPEIDRAAEAIVDRYGSPDRGARNRRRRRT